MGKIYSQSDLQSQNEKLEKIISQNRIEIEFYKKNAEKYQILFDNAADMIAVVDKQGNFIDLNKKFEEESGYNRLEMIGENVFDCGIVTSLSSETMAHYLGEMLSGGQWPIIEIEGIRKDGGIVPYELRAVPHKRDGEIVEVHAILRNISNRKQADEELLKHRSKLEELVRTRTHELEKANEDLKESEEKYRNIIENIEEGYFEVDLKGNLTFLNDSLCKLVRLSKNELIGMNNMEYTTPETAKKMFDTFNEVYRTSEPVNLVDYEVARKDGSTAILSLSVSLMRDHEENPIGFRGVVRDVSNKRKAEQEKRKLEAQLNQAQKMESIGTLAGGIAHDFNNLLMSIQGKISIMLFHIDSDNENYCKLRDIEGYIQNGSNLTRQLLGFARGGKYEVKTTNLNQLIESTSKMFSGTKKEIKIHKNYETNLMDVDTDQGQINQVLLNLYINAWQAMPDGGDLYIHTENLLLDEKTANTYQIELGNYVKLSITDNGDGMDKETMNKIFDPFFTTKEFGRGTGLGLASTYGIIRNHNGAITVYSEKGKGATFNIYLPVSKKTNNDVDFCNDTDKVLKGSETILFVDDEKRVLDSVNEMLKELGYKVILAESGEKAVHILRENHHDIDLAIIDMIMPGMGGYELYKEIKAITEDIKVLLASGYSKNSHTEDILEMGCDGFMQKPFTLQQLSQIIRSILGKK